MVLAFAGLEGAVACVRGRIVGAADTVKDVLAVAVVVSSGGVAGFKAEDVGSHEAVNRR